MDDTTDEQLIFLEDGLDVFFSDPAPYPQRQFPRWLALLGVVVAITFGLVIPVLALAL